LDFLFCLFGARGNIVLGPVVDDGFYEVSAVFVRRLLTIRFPVRCDSRENDLEIGSDAVVIKCVELVLDSNFAHGKHSVCLEKSA